MMLNQLFKSIIDSDRAPIVVCNMDSVVVYMNPASLAYYHIDLTGKDIRLCHNAASNEKMKKVLDWFAKSKENNVVYTFRNDEQNKDVYMIALRNAHGDLIGYYEKHEYRNRETGKLYDI